MACDERVERVEQRAGREARRGERAERAAQLAHDGGRLDPAAHDVADDEGGGLLLVEPEGVIPVAADLVAGLRRAVEDLDAQVRGQRRVAGEQAALQELGDLVLASARSQQLLLVGAAVGRVEDRRADGPRPPGVVAPLDGVDERRQPGAVGTHDVQRDLAYRALHLQQRAEVRLVVDAPGRRQQVAKARAQQRGAVVSGPALERAVDAQDRAVDAAGENSRTARPRRDPPPPRRAARRRASRHRRAPRRPSRVDERPDRGDRLLRGAEVGAVAGGLELHVSGSRPGPRRT